MVRDGSIDKQAVWGERFRRFAESGMTVVDFCGTEGVSAPSFYAWRRKLRGRTQSDPEPPFGGKLQAFERLVVTSASAVTVRFPNGVSIEVPTDQQATLRTVVGELLRAEHPSENEEPSC